jgi:plastocyanin domain-containing protein
MKKTLSLAAVILAVAAWGCQQDSSSTAKPAGAAPTEQVAKVDVTENGFVPAELTVKAGQPLKLTFTRLTDKTCATEVVIGEEKLTKELPLNTPVMVELTPKQNDIVFACGMNMYSGKIVVK